MVRRARARRGGNAVGEDLCNVLAEPKYSGIKYVWYDYWCMPQGADKTPEQKVQFKWMLQNINSLYLGCHVLILLDLSYLSRFWTQFEAWLAMQTATKEGLRPASEAEQRWDVRPILNANSMVVHSLQDMWRGVTLRMLSRTSRSRTSPSRTRLTR